MNRTLSLFCLLACACSVGAETKEETAKLLVGRWEMKRKVGERELRGEMQITPAGKVTMTIRSEKGDQTLTGTWKLLGAKKLEMTFTIMDRSLADEYDLKLTKDTLELTDKGRMTQRWTRLK